MSNTMYVHDVNLGEPMDEEEIAQALAEHGDSPAVRVIMQLLRNRAADSDRAARDEADRCRERCGEAKAYEEAFWFLFTHTAFVPADRRAGTGAAAVADPDEAEHAAGGEE